MFKGGGEIWDGKRHDFYETNIRTGIFCNVCRKKLCKFKKVYKCKVCSFVVHKSCLIRAPKKCPPWNFEEEWQVVNYVHHYWIEGGGVDNECERCSAPLNGSKWLHGYRCHYCRIACCPKCFSSLENNKCTGGLEVTIPPGRILTRKSNCPVDWDIHLDENERVNPLVVFINDRSADVTRKELEYKFSRVLNPIQVVNLGRQNPSSMLSWMQKNRIQYTICVCGGDGTLAWILSTLDTLKTKNLPRVFILPFGTGNDMAYTLGWDDRYCDMPIEDIISDVLTGKEVRLDRWRMEIKRFESFEKSIYTVNNYFSIGLDAAISLKFHRARESNPKSFCSRKYNKLYYTKLGFLSLFQPGINLSNVLHLEVDGRHVQLPNKIQCVIILNLNSWAGGTDLWRTHKNSNWRQQKCHDQILEVVGLKNAFHLVGVRLKLFNAIRLAQGSNIVITWLEKCKLPVQADGEPWEESFSTIALTYHSATKMLAAPGKLNSSLEDSTQKEQDDVCCFKNTRKRR
ncbi:diacylglycerol kinase epsilon-like [Schistocerca gregaria]|uniref:diacylglycerol kinase epsilon-like n=1 Tax=Schistocerca gregaria TaxID=7010 RepID=UPI00211EE27D|nr:diacylglycerol kinase epsilon-like [Schistocerca gregaria]XP_049848821.1 diacylglycerol kinase epsilon-like [Schistocerca gregaria]